MQKLRRGFAALAMCVLPVLVAGGGLMGCTLPATSSRSGSMPAKAQKPPFEEDPLILPLELREMASESLVNQPTRGAPVINRASILLSLTRMRMRVSIDDLDRLHATLEREIRSISNYLDSLPEDDEGASDAITEEGCERIEALLGIALVFARTYLTAVRTAIARASAFSRETTGFPLTFVGDEKGYGVFTTDNPTELSTGRSVIEVVNAIANYWKHHDEWPTRLVPQGEFLEQQWDTSGLRPSEQKTIEIVSALGLRPSNSGNLRAAISALGIADYHDLSPLRRILETWAHRLVQRVEEELRELSSGKETAS